MKQIITTILIISSFFFMSFTKKGQKQTITIRTQIYCDHCLQCGSCGANINDKIRDANKGIKKVVINSKENTIKVTYNDAKTTPDKIKEAILSAGYDADDKKSSIEFVNKLDGCCKKK